MASTALAPPLSTLRLGALAVLAGAAATILAALAFEHLGGYLPCPLCLQQRYAYYAAMPLAAAAFLLARPPGTALARLLLALAGLAFAVNAGLGVYHSGVEWGWWTGPADCATAQPIGTSAGGLLQSLNETRVVACDEAPWRLLGLSFAGWNAAISAGLALAAAAAALRGRP